MIEHYIDLSAHIFMPGFHWEIKKKLKTYGKRVQKIVRTANLKSFSSIAPAPFD
ncbi:Z-ring formation inhibitor MciZ [Cytobacillus firmus]|uniref:Z-ring formation inhibitor MciZ n=1 Tax=Cytobacillus firmus TaxID=1399 RepID=UPI0037BF5053